MKVKAIKNSTYEIEIHIYNFDNHQFHIMKYRKMFSRILQNRANVEYQRNNLKNYAVRYNK